MCRLVVCPVVLGATVLHGPVTFDERSLMIGGERELFFGGAVHYPRVRPADWGKVFHLAKEMGLNTIQTYVFWNEHEQHLQDRGNASWSGWNDLPAFIHQAEENDLYIALRIGPYICGEYHFGGLPVWLRDTGGIECFRCQDSVWEAEMKRWVTEVVDVVRPQLQPRGNIIMLQIENEYSGDQSYLDWSVDMANSLTENEAVPWHLCHAYRTCFATNNRDGMYKFRALCAMNGFWQEEYQKDPDQPSPKFINDLRKFNPGQPAIWTEDQGWYDQWGVAKRIRYSSNQLYGIARWFAYGGSYHNFYMLTGGNNYGLKAGGDTVTAYAPDAVISPYLLKHEPRFRYYTSFFHTLTKYKDMLLSNPVAALKKLLVNSTVTHNSTAALLSCTDSDPAHAGQLDDSQLWDFAQGLVRTNFTGAQLCLDALQSTSPPSLVACNSSCKSQLFTFNDSTGELKSVIKGLCQKPADKGKECYRCLDMGKSGTDLNLWDCKEDHSNQQFNLDGKGGLRPDGYADICLSGTVSGGGTVELQAYGDLAFLSNTALEPLQVSYLNTTFALAPESVLLVDRATKKVVFNTGDAVDPEDQEPQVVDSRSAKQWQAFTEAFGNGAKSLVDSSLHEQLNLTQNDVDYLWYSTEVVAGLTAADIVIQTAGSSKAYLFVENRQLHVLSAAMGLKNTGVGPRSHAGVVSVKVGDTELPGPWNHSWVLEGEHKRIFDEKTTDVVDWKIYSNAFATTPCTWLKASMDLPSDADLADSETAFALDLSSMSKGIAYFNGLNLGRYWSTHGTCQGDCAPPIKNGRCYMHWKDCDKPTQTLYHVPSDVLQRTGNLVVLFEEAAPVELTRDPSAVKLVALRASGKQQSLLSI